jgi:DNA-binding MarR family transcriptional regulator
MTRTAAKATTTPTGVQPDLDLARLLTIVERGVVLRLAEALKADGTTIEEWRVLCLLADRNGHAMTEIAEYALLPAPSLTKLVDRMVSQNLVIRRVDDVDRRRVLVFASDRGVQALQRFNATAEREYDDVVAALGSEEIALLKALLTRASKRLGRA